MTTIDETRTTTSGEVRHELLAASDEQIAEAVRFANPMVLRGVLYQLTGDEELAEMKLERRMYRGREGNVLADPADVDRIREKAKNFLIKYRDSGAGPIDLGPMERLPKSMGMAVSSEIPDDEVELWIEETGLNPWARSLQWRREPPADRLANFSVAVLGTGLGGLNAAVQLKRAGIPFTVFEKNHGVGGTWYENRYPGCRVDTPSHAYNHLYGASYELEYPFCPQPLNEKYFNWVTDEFGVRDSIEFETEVKSLTWDETDNVWIVVTEHKGEQRERRVNAVISSVGMLAHPNIPNFPGKDDFKGQAFHTARWPEGVDYKGKRVAVIGSGCTGYQLFPELAKDTSHIALFQIEPSWVFDVPNYLEPFPDQTLWMKRNFPYLVNFVRLNTSWDFRPDASIQSSFIDPDYNEDPDAVSEYNKRIRDERIAFMKSKFGDRTDLLEGMLPSAPPGSSRPVLVDRRYSIYDVLMRDDAELVTSRIKRWTEKGIETEDGKEHEFDIIVMATGFRADDFLLPMPVTGRNGVTLADVWAKDGPRAYIGVMVPGFPNFFMIYGPNTNPSSGLNLAAHHEMTGLFALKCIEELILSDKSTVEVKEEAYWRFNEELDKDQKYKIYLDPRAQTYYVNNTGSVRRSATNAAIDARVVFHWLREPAGNPRKLRPELEAKAQVISPNFGKDLIVQ